MPRKSKSAERNGERDGGERDGEAAVLAPPEKVATATKKGRSAKEAAPVVIEITAPKIRVVRIPIVGVTSLITHAWDEKAIKQMLDKMTGVAHKSREKKDPEAEYHAGLYLSDDGWAGVPSTAFKAAMVGACRMVTGITMTLAKRLFFAKGDGVCSKHNVTEITRIFGEHRQRRDMVRINNGASTDIRFRPEFPRWEAVLTVEFDDGIISAQQVVNLVAKAGYHEGVGEWRPSAPKSDTGTHGRWKIKTGAAVEILEP